MDEFQISKDKKLKLKFSKQKRFIFVILFLEGYFCDKNLKSYLRELLLFKSIE